MIEQFFRCVNFGKDKPLINDAAQSAHAVEGAVKTDDRLLVIATEARYPIVIFTQSLSDSDEFAIHVSRCLGDATMN